MYTCLFLQLIYKMLYKNSGCATGTLRFFREKLQRWNVTSDVKHYEECEQLFITVGRAYTVAALLQFFGIDDSPNHNLLPNYVIHGDGDKKLYFDNVLDKFVSEYLMPSLHAIHLDQSLHNQLWFVNYFNIMATTVHIHFWVWIFF